MVHLPLVLTDGFDKLSFFGFSHISLHTEILKMGLKSNERDHLPIRWLKPLYLLYLASIFKLTKKLPKSVSGVTWV